MNVAALMWLDVAERFDNANTNTDGVKPIVVVSVIFVFVDVLTAVDTVNVPLLKSDEPPPPEYVPVRPNKLIPLLMFSARKLASVADRLTAEFPAVPLETYPAETDGVTETVFESVSVVELCETVALVPDIVAGAVAEPLDTDLVAVFA